MISLTKPKVHLLRRVQRFPRSRAEVFEFFSRPENLAAITPAALDFTVMTPSPIPMGAGSLIDYTIRLGIVRVRWTTAITEFDAPHRFADVQLRGPYSYWHHAHIFRDVEGGTEMVDEVHYVVPGGLLSGMPHALFVRPQLEKIFDHRAKVMAERLGRM